MAYSSRRNREDKRPDLRDISADAFCAHMVVVDGHKGNCKISSYHTVLEVPKPSGCNDKTSEDRS